MRLQTFFGHVQNLTNDFHAKTRELRLRKEAIIEEETIRHELKEYDKEKAIKNREMEDFIKEETKALENRIKSKVRLSQNEFMKSSIYKK